MEPFEAVIVGYGSAGLGAAGTQDPRIISTGKER
jgi:hypothetical protein